MIKTVVNVIIFSTNPMVVLYSAAGQLRDIHRPVAHLPSPHKLSYFLFSSFLCPYPSSSKIEKEYKDMAYLLLTEKGNIPVNFPFTANSQVTSERLI